MAELNEELSISKVVALMLPKWPLLLISTLIVAIGAYFYTSYMVDPIYVASGTLYITGDVNAISGSIKQDTNLSDLMVSQELAKTYGQILSSNTFFKDVADKSDSGYSYAAIQGMSTITNVEGTGMLKISVSHTNPQMAANLANTILNLAPDEIARVVVAGSATIIDPAEVPKAPASPSVPRNTALGAIIGFVAAAGYVFLRFLLDQTIKSAEEIETIFHLPVLGLIPTIEDGVADSEGYYHYGQPYKR